MTLAFECLPVYSIGRHFRGRGRGLEVPTPLELTNQHVDLSTSLATPGWGKREAGGRACARGVPWRQGAMWLQPATKGVSLRSRPGRRPPPGVAVPPREAAESCEVGGEFRGPRRQKSLRKAILLLMYSQPQTSLSPFSFFLQPLEEQFLRKILYFRKGCGSLF